MIRVVAFVLAAAVLTGCGADGDPVTPTANVGVGVSSSGVSVGTTVSVQRGPWNLSLGGIL